MRDPNEKVVVVFLHPGVVESAFMESMINLLMYDVSLNKRIVHGGGWRIDELMRQTGMESRRHRGVRITDERTLTIIEMAAAGVRRPGDRADRRRPVLRVRRQGRGTADPVRAGR